MDSTRAAFEVVRRVTYVVVHPIEGEECIGDPERGEEEIKFLERHARQDMARCQESEGECLLISSIIKRIADSDQVRKSMARIKWVLQERRMGLIATLGPKIDEDNAPLRPASWSDPANQYDAIRGQAKYEDVRLPKALRRISTRDQAKMPQREQEQREDRDATVGDEEVSETEVESRDGGYAGKEAEDFVKETEIDEDGRVRKV